MVFNFIRVWLKMLSANRIAGFSKQLYLKKKLMNQFHFWHVDTDLRNIKDCFVTF